MAKKDEGSEVDQLLVKALAHPLRVRLLKILERGPSSPKRMSDEIGEPLGNVSYHVNVLQECGCIEFVRSRPARGAVEHFYRAKIEKGVGSRIWQTVPDSLRGDAAADALDAFAGRAIEALQAGTMQSRDGSGVNWISLNVDEAGWQEVLHILKGVEDRFRTVAEESAARFEEGAVGIPLVLAVAAFEMPQGATGS